MPALDMTWLTAMAVESLARHLGDAVGERLTGWVELLPSLASAKDEGIQHADLRVGLRALHASLHAVSGDTKERMDAVLHQLSALKEQYPPQDTQSDDLKEAIGAVNSLYNEQLHDDDVSGNTRRIALLDTAARSADRATVAPEIVLARKFQAYRIWVVTKYIHALMSSNGGHCKTAKKYVVDILGDKILRDHELLQVCSDYLNGRGDGGATNESQGEETTMRSETQTYTSGSNGVEANSVIEFLFEIASSVSVLPPLDADVRFQDVIKIEGADGEEAMKVVGGGFAFGDGVPKAVSLAMGWYCADNPTFKYTYPTLSAPALAAWNQRKERLALDEVFRRMGGEDWYTQHGWTRPDEELGDRFGVALENGHVSKLCLASNNLRGTLPEELVDCEHLRELQLHGNDVSAAVPQRLLDMIHSRPNMVVTGLPGVRNVPAPRPAETIPQELTEKTDADYATGNKVEAQGETRRIVDLAELRHVDRRLSPRVPNIRRDRRQPNNRFMAFLKES